MQIVTHSYRHGAWSVVSVAGELDVVGGPDLRQCVMTEIREGRHNLVLDLTGVDFIDSFGLGVIVGSLKRVRLLDGELRLVVPEPRVRRVFEICDLDRVFELHPTVESAARGRGVMSSDVPRGDEMAVADFRPAEIVLEVPALTEYLSLVRVVIAAAAEIEPDMAHDRIEDLRVAVSEATTNAMEAQHLHGVAQRIRIECTLADDEVAVVIHDQGRGFEPDRIPALPEPDAPSRLRHESGLGVHLIQMLTDESEISTTESGTDVRLVVYSSKRRRLNSDR